MFAVLGYQIENEDVLMALKTVKKHLKKDGFFICDFWYGPAVLHEKPGEKVRFIQQEDIKIIRASKGILDIFHHLVKVHFHLWKIKSDKIISETTEEHTMRFFFPQELNFFLQQAGLKLITITSFSDPTNEPDESEWNAQAIVRSD